MNAPRRMPHAFYAVAVLAALLLAVVQGLALGHAASHGFSSHDHHGHECAVSSYLEHQSLADNAPSVPVPPAWLEAFQTPAAANLPTPFISSNAPLSARAPPCLS